MEKMNAFKRKRLFYSLVVLAITQSAFAPLSQAARAPSSKEKLARIATHIVIGQVRAIYSHKEEEGIPIVSGYEYDRKVSEVKIEKVEKGKISESLVYVRYWSRAWKGIGLPPPGGQSYHPQPRNGELCRFYLSKNSFDGWSDENQDGGYNVVYLNGVQTLKK